ncbi:hypothetical protein B0H17DRAFT_1145206 [Mycena rosella]|uniref:Uncharacterized protein n=1 Tax=Mycena rosella TaxID=1033263 RepID=A0AAD7CRN5_MYCRO|nr:hypothetical protein B0H17DRAFT_1145206 [Mycena rosella]
MYRAFKSIPAKIRRGHVQPSHVLFLDIHFKDFSSACNRQAVVSHVTVTILFMYISLAHPGQGVPTPFLGLKGSPSMLPLILARTSHVAATIAACFCRWSLVLNSNAGRTLKVLVKFQITPAASPIGDASSSSINLKSSAAFHARAAAQLASTSITKSLNSKEIERETEAMKVYMLKRLKTVQDVIDSLTMTLDTRVRSDPDDEWSETLMEVRNGLVQTWYFYYVPIFECLTCIPSVSRRHRKQARVMQHWEKPIGISKF